MRSSVASRLTTLFSTGWICNLRPLPFVSRLIAQQTNTRGYHSSTSVALACNHNEDDLQRWERMFADGMKSSSTNLSIEPSEEVSVRSKVYVVTFDLDNTLWNTSATISAANDALAEHMQVFCTNISSSTNATVTRVEKRMQSLHEASPERYGPTLETSARTKAPVRLTTLRKDAIRRVLIDEAGFADDDVQVEPIVDEAFKVWVDARHDSIPVHFAASGVLDSLQAIRASTDIVAIGAITDGNSDPLAIPDLKRYFDFCINAEQVGIGKPDRRVYQKAVEYVLEQFPWLHSKILAWEENDDKSVETVGPWWVHVGDDFVKDVVAAKNFGMRSVWSRELVVGKLQPESLMKKRSPTRDLESFVKEVSSMDVIEMQIGADDYLAESIQAEFADAIVDQFLDVANTIQQWQSDAAEDEKEGDFIGTFTKLNVLLFQSQMNLFQL